MPVPIGALARKTGVNIETIRYYERIGILAAPPRTGGGHRMYDDDQFKRLSFVRRTRHLGFSLDEIRTLLSLIDSQSYSCEDVRDITRRHLDAIRQRIKDLRRMEHVLDEIAAQCDGGQTPDCPIIDALHPGDGIGP